MIGTLWYQLQAIEKGASRPADIPRRAVRRLGILGAGMMGAGIAYAAAKVGIEVLLLDTSPDNAVRGRQFSQDLTDKAAGEWTLQMTARDGNFVDLPDGNIIKVRDE